MNDLDLNSAYILDAAPTALVLTVDELKVQCRVDHNVEDSLIGDLGLIATKKVEDDSRWLLRPVTVELQLDRFPCSGTPIYVERSPVTDVTSITYVDSAGDVQTWDSAKYIAGLGSLPPRIVPAFGQAWPTIRRQPASVKVTFEGGFAATTDAGFPLLAKQTIRLLVGAWYDRPDTAGVIPPEIERAYWNLINNFAWGAL